MKLKQAAIAALFLFALVLAGCAATGGASNVATFPQTAQRVCTVIQPTFVSIHAELPLLTPPLPDAQQAAIGNANDAVTAFCAATATATAPSAQAMLNATIPVVLNAISTADINPQTRNAMILSLVGVQTAANVLIAQAQPAQPVEAPAAVAPAK